jgi:predicted Ser/Thr protein kinase
MSLSTDGKIPPTSEAPPRNVVSSSKRLSPTMAVQSTQAPSGNDFAGMKWVTTIWGPELRWAVKPDRTAILRTIRTALNLQEPCSIKFLAQGGFNKVYIVSSADQEVVARVALPVMPKDKTLSEVAVLNWVRQNTSLPVPRVLAYDADRFNPIGFEWIAMEKAEGKPWREVWKDLDKSARETIVRQVAHFCADTFRLQMRGIGNIYPPVVASHDSALASSTRQGAGKLQAAPQVQHMVAGYLMTKTKNYQYTSRGPFDTSREWITARLEVAELDCRARLDGAQLSATIETDSRQDQTVNGINV